MSDREPIKDYRGAWWLAQQEANGLREKLKQLEERFAVATKQVEVLREEVAELATYKRARDLMVHGNPDALHDRAQRGELFPPPQVFRQGGWEDA